jgi:hypothetical protein
MIDNAAILARDAQPCTCGHRNVSHGSFAPGHVFVGTGNGPCGIDRDTRNALTGWIGDPCPCTAFDLQEESKTMKTPEEIAAETRRALEIRPGDDWVTLMRDQFEAVVARAIETDRAQHRPDASNAAHLLATFNGAAEDYQTAQEDPEGPTVKDEEQYGDTMRDLAPELAEELAKRLSMEQAARSLADTLTGLDGWDHWTSFNCGEADAIVRFLRTMGKHERAADILRAHADGDSALEEDDPAHLALKKETDR